MTMLPAFQSRMTTGLICVAALLACGCAPTGASTPAPVAASVELAPALEAAGPEQVESLKAMLVGSWKAPGTGAGSENEAGFWMHIAPVTVEGLDNTLYVEQCRGDEPASPYRQAVFQVYLNRGKLRLRTMDLRSVTPGGGPWALAWLAPDKFPPIDAKNLIATLDLEFKPAGDGFDGRTPYPYPNADRGAVEMTSEMKVSKDRLMTTDKGYAADGTVVWGASGGDALTWERADPGFKVERNDDGLVIITIAQPEGGAVPVDGDTLYIDYTLWLPDGLVVDSSSKSGRLMPAQFPLQEGPRGLVPGFVRGLAGVTEGSIRRLIIPPALGWGETARGPIPANSTVYFLVEINTVQKPLPPEPEAEEGAGPDAGGGEGDAGGGGH